ncbi:MAG: hypothetical protein NT007_18445 [Candidatus Kapabacteria bacterium]|nr:hypothetical protein [Candidatus Kapabacteria bacterium]
MRYFNLVTISAITLFYLQSCSSLTRIEKDQYAITVRDTTYQFYERNAPGERDDGVIYPSSKSIRSERNTTWKDSIVVREYPDFIRFGLFESVGLLFAGNQNNSMKAGMFGIFPDLGKLLAINVDTGKKGGIVGRITRFGIGEFRLRWFRDAKDWTWGFYGFEAISPDAGIENTLLGYLPFYIKKRFYLKETIPYIALTASAGFGIYPSKYINLSTSADIGSIGGLNLRAYLGYVYGVNSAQSDLVNYMPSEGAKKAVSVSCLYGGLGISMLDFVNRVPETYREWKDHEHSSWDIGLMQLAFIGTGSDSSLFSSRDNPNTKLLLSGFQLKLVNSDIAIPILNNGFYAGTSLINLIILGRTEWGLGILPIRLGYWQTVLEDELSVSPFIEFSYYPSSIINLGIRVNLALHNMVNISLLGGYTSGSTSLSMLKDLNDSFGTIGNFSRYYFGFQFGFIDQIFFPQNLRYNK